MLSNIPNHDERSQTCHQCNELIEAGAIEAAQQRKEALICHYERILVNWATANSVDNKLSTTTTITIPVLCLIDLFVYEGWKALFESKGYTVVLTEHSLTISFTL